MDSKLGILNKLKVKKINLILERECRKRNGK